MKFGETFTEYLHGDRERFLQKCSHIEYKRLKEVLKTCRRCNAFKGCANNVEEYNQLREDESTQSTQLYESCPLCDQMFFSELKKEASDIVGCLSSRGRRLIHLHAPNQMQKYFISLCQCFTSNQQATAQECRLLIEYVAMNAIALRKILKKYDKIHCSVSGRIFKSKIRTEHIEPLQSPWLMELGAFYINFKESNGGNQDNDGPFSCDLSATEPIMILMLPDSVKLEYNLTCAICLDTVYKPYALRCGHLFCKPCACSAASVMIFEGLKSASPESKCPICREVGVYANAMHMTELDLLLKKHYQETWKERLAAEREAIVKQSKLYWDLQTKLMIGY
ncbi:probable E3 ubiquitin-protein ligase BAH1-like [Olea europaea var. sylvestris]|uniref:probable E3 ubiquitin-protein ligase BAH1-like n=1 Tax=Olea europaea var. sylvestris TaxID=158386 RepID=UPI000C1D68DD|nr:probable E3 ubiquitin-protein ligase BAH1-like [Olea europaea var. sylvestris]